MSESDRLLADESTLYDSGEDTPVTKASPEVHKNYFSDVPNFYWIEISLLINVFLFGLDGTITSSTYSTIGSEFKAMNLVSWISSSYMIASSATLPLASMSDLFGRRTCIIVALSFFSIGCFGCSIAGSMKGLVFSRAVTGIGGGGLVSLSTITNSDIVYTSRRGLVHAVQVLILGTGSVCGASFGGIMTSYLGWRWCFGLQVIPTVFSLVVAILFIPNVTSTTHIQSSNESVYHKIDFSGSITMILALVSQLCILTIGGNEIPWISWEMAVLTAFSIALTYIFFQIEINTSAKPIIPIKEYKDTYIILSVFYNYFIGVACYTYIFLLPLLFQLNLGDNVAQTGLRLSIPAICTPIGGLFAGYYMARLPSFSRIVLCGTVLMVFGHFIGLGISNKVPGWLIDFSLMPANLGQGLVYPSSLFTFVYYFEPEKQASSTSTVYLMRNIGGVWGISLITTIIQGILRSRLKGDLRQLKLGEGEVNTIVDATLKSLDVLKSVREEVKLVIVKDYTLAIRVCQCFSGTCCVLAFVCYVVSERYKKRS